MNKLHLTTRQETNSVTIVQPNVNLRKPIEKKFPGPKILTLIACHTNNVAKVNIIKNNIMYFQALPNNDIVVINSFDSKYHKDIKEYLEKVGRTVKYYGILNASTLDCGKWMFYLQNHYRANTYRHVIFTNDSFLIRGDLQSYYLSLIHKNVDLFGYNDSTQVRYHYQSYLFTLKHTAIKRFVMYYKRIKHKLKGYQSVVDNIELRLTDIFRNKDCFVKIGMLPSNRGRNIFFNNDSLYLQLYNDKTLPFIKLKRIVQDRQQKRQLVKRDMITNQ